MKEFSLLFWDFDGVIKDSVEVKAAAFEQLFRPFGSGVAARVRKHHEDNGGLSRYEKLPLYLSWAGHSATADDVARYSARFSDLVRQAVIDCAWVPGAREYLHANHARQQSILITATPQAEIENILQALAIAGWFREIHGAPTPKADAVAAVLKRRRCPARDALLIGDSETDWAAAMRNGVQFLLRRTAHNRNLQSRHTGSQCEDFNDG